MVDVSTTEQHYDKYIGDILLLSDNCATNCARKMEKVFGEEIHTKIDGFIEFAKSNDIDDHDIKATLLHDLSGGLCGDKWMIPRVDAYGDFSNNSKN
jgi:hypothetical protein